jgi:hypothetical protein
MTNWKQHGQGVLESTDDTWRLLLHNFYLSKQIALAGTIGSGAARQNTTIKLQKIIQTPKPGDTPAIDEEDLHGHISERQD